MYVMSLCVKGLPKFRSIWTNFASVELKIFETVIAFLNNRISCIAVTIIQFFSQISPHTFVFFWEGLNQALGGAKARLAPPRRTATGYGLPVLQQLCIYILTQCISIL